jgi:hypothetical protein
MGISEGTQRERREQRQAEKKHSPRRRGRCRNEKGLSRRKERAEEKEEKKEKKRWMEVAVAVRCGW